MVIAHQMTQTFQQSQQHRRQVMKVLLWITVVAGCVYAFINFSRGVWLLGSLELAYVGFSFWLYTIIDTTLHVRRWIMVFAIPLLGLITYALYLPSTSDTMFTWILVTPVVLYLLLGSRLGLLFSVVFVAINIVVYQLRFFTGDWTSLHNAGIYNVLICSIAITVFSHLYERTRETNEARLIDLAGTDPLTRLPNRMKLSEEFDYLRAQSDRSGEPVAVAMIDLDHFKSINDDYGHGIGDQALFYVARFITQNTREVDLTARMGGEEFILVMPNTSAMEAQLIVDRLRETLSGAPIELEGKALTVTFSAGIAVYAEDGSDLENLVMAADRRLYSAKNRGRNQVVATV